MNQAFINIGWAVIFIVVGGITGILLILTATLLVPRILNRFTPNLNEDKEIARGNRAVAEYYGRVVSATIVAIGIVIAAAILGGVISALY